MIAPKAYAREKVYGSPVISPTSGRSADKSGKNSVWLTKIFRGDIATIPLEAENTEGSLWPVKTEFINELDLSRGKVNLNWPLRIYTVLSGDYFLTSNDDLDVHSYGSTLEESRQNFSEIFEEMLDLYNRSSNEELTGDAIRLKALFDKIVKS